MLLLQQDTAAGGVEQWIRGISYSVYCITRIFRSQWMQAYRCFLVCMDSIRISTAQESYTVGASEVYAVSPFTLYRAVSGENAGVLQITLSPEILQKADWSPRQMIDCYLSRSTLKDSVAQDIRRRCATLFRLYFQQTNQAELQRQAVSLASLLWSRFSTADSVQPEGEHQHTETAGICTEKIHTQWNQSICTVPRRQHGCMCRKAISRVCSKVCGDHIYQVSG